MVFCSSNILLSKGGISEVVINREYSNRPANVEKENSLWGEKAKPLCCVALILLVLRRGHDVNMRLLLQEHINKQSRKIKQH